MESTEQAFDNLEALKSTLYHFADSFATCYVLDSNQTETALKEGPYEMLVAIGEKKPYTGTLSEQLDKAYDSGHWSFLALPYGSIDKPTQAFHIVQPEMVFSIRRNENALKIHNNGISKQRFQFLLRAFRGFEHEKAGQAPVRIDFHSETSEQAYLEQVETIRNDIYNGKYYELNYCIEFKAHSKTKGWLPYYLRLNASTKAPFAAYMKCPKCVMLCSSPERFLLKQSDRLLSQPIKGTNKRLQGKENEKQLEILRNSEKERAENVMIVDLVRNDLAKVSIPGSVKVNELYKAYAYLSVNHLVSSISSELKERISLSAIIRALYPMGSMTGAPKVEVMKHIEAYEKGSRGLYSGCLGYIKPSRDFDLNVVIRTLVYDSQSSEISYKVGSAITYDSVAKEEYDECMIKGSRMLSTFDI